ncbi:MAG: GntR family transcriptional regulator [Rhodothalassiaceae bacterium]
MSPEWTDDQPIYRQLRDKVVSAILDGTFSEGAPLPSVRSVAVDLQINPLTAQKAYQELVMEELVEKRRGLGMFVVEGAREKLLAEERRHFLEEEWPKVLRRIEQLGLSPADLLQTGPKRNGGHA